MVLILRQGLCLKHRPNTVGGSGWPPTSYVTKDDLEFLILLYLSQSAGITGM